MKIGGVSFILNGIEQDYNFKESIKCMQDCCDQVFIVDAGSTDGTRDVLLSLENERTRFFFTQDRTLWDSIQGHEKLSVFTNIAIDQAQKAGMDYIFSLQMDECLHEDGYDNLRAAAEQGYESVVMNRYNLFRDPWSMLNVPQERKPCSTEVIRLAKSKYRAYSDAEHIHVPSVNTFKSLDAMEIFHMGFVRDRVKILGKIRHMLVDVFRVEMDKRAENCEKFEWDRWFKESDLLPIPKPLPKVVQRWAEERYPEVKA